VTAAGWAAEPAPATVVLQLPPSMSPESVKGLISDLAAKGVQPTASPSDTPDAASPALMTGMNVAAQMWEETKQAMRAVPALRQALRVWVRRVGGGALRRPDWLAGRRAYWHCWYKGRQRRFASDAPARR
jgi:hypothetical protein